MEGKKIIAIVGMAGSGKTEITKYLIEKLGCPKIYLGKHTFDRMEKEGLEVSYKNERMIREKIRSELGMGAYAKLSLSDIKEKLKEHSFLILESLSSWAEYKIIKEKYGDSFAVVSSHASPRIRFARLIKRKKERPMKDWEEFQARDYTELEGLEKGGPIAMADYLVVNEKSLGYLHEKLDDFLEKISK
jgi:dephospho-CoA kinase